MPGWPRSGRIGVGHSLRLCVEVLVGNRKSTLHHWPRRGPAERRLHPRVKVQFPIAIDDPDGPCVEGLTCDIGLGGVRVTLSRYLELFTRLPLTVEPPVTGREGEMSLQGVAATVAVVRIEPDEEVEDCEAYDVSLAFTGVSNERDRVIGTFMLQTLLFDQEAELT